jgi:hypothetical protein
MLVQQASTQRRKGSNAWEAVRSERYLACQVSPLLRQVAHEKAKGDNGEATGPGAQARQPLPALFQRLTPHVLPVGRNTSSPTRAEAVENPTCCQPQQDRLAVMTALSAAARPTRRGSACNLSRFTNLHAQDRWAALAWASVCWERVFRAGEKAASHRA